MESPRTEQVESQSRSLMLSDEAQRRKNRRRLEKLKQRNIKSVIKPEMRKYTKIAKMRSKTTKLIVNLTTGQASFNTSIQFDSQTYTEKPSVQTAETNPEMNDLFTEGEHSVLGNEDLLLLMDDRLSPN